MSITRIHSAYGPVSFPLPLSSTVLSRANDPSYVLVSPANTCLAFTILQVPRDGAWNMVDKKFHIPCTVERWAFLVFEREARFNDHTVTETIQGLVKACQDVGM